MPPSPMISDAIGQMKRTPELVSVYSVFVTTIERTMLTVGSASATSSHLASSTVTTTASSTPTSSSAAVVLNTFVQPVSSSSLSLTTSASLSSTTSSSPYSAFSAVPLAEPTKFEPVAHDRSNVSNEYNPTTLIVCIVIIGLMVVIALSWLVRRVLRRGCARDLQAIVNDEVVPDEKICRNGDRRSAVTTNLKPSSRWSSSFGVDEEASPWLREPGGLHDSVIGVATTTSMPASSSKSAVAREAYPKMDMPRISETDEAPRPVSTGASEVGRLMLGSLVDTATREHEKVSAQRKCHEYSSLIIR